MRRDPVRPTLVEVDPLEPYVLESSTVVATLLVSPNGEIVAANARMRALLAAVSPQSPLGRRLTDYPTEPTATAAWAHALESPSESPITIRLRRTDGALLVLRGEVRPVPAATDRSRKLLQALFVESEEEQLKGIVRQSARMEALGSLTAGIAHDFNNLLTVLVGNLYLAVEEVRDQPKLFEKLKSARDAGKRGADLIRQLLTFARVERVEPEVVNPCAVIDSLLPLLKRALGGRIKLDTGMDPEAGPVRASTAQLESVIVNLTINARDAIEKKGNVTVEVRAASVAATEAARRGLPKAGSYVAISVRDDGAGIPSAVLGRIFEPFFSTKLDRGGTGLGLSMVRWFAETAGGCAFAESTLGAGTTVTLLLPRAGEEVTEPTDKTMPLSILPTGTEAILVLAPEEALRTTIRQILEVLGYRVRFAADPGGLPEAALDGTVQLVIADVAHRNEQLTELLATLKRILPRAAVIVTTDVPLPADRQHPADVMVLSKPFSIADLATAVRRTLDHGRPALAPPENVRR